MGAARISSISILASLSLLLAAGAASAQSNTITIKQTGTGNTLSVDQSNASNSSVGGLSFSVGSEQQSIVDNRDPDDGLSEETVPINPLIVATPGVADDTATQSGNGNSAEINISGEGGFAFLNQKNDLGQTGNKAIIGLTTDGGIAAVGQVGYGNSATLNVDGGLKGTILQNGNENTANLSVTGSAEGFISQNGNRNDTGLVKVNGVDTSVTYIQQGNDLSSVNGTGVTVSSNARAVTITQSTLTGGN